MLGSRLVWLRQQSWGEPLPLSYLRDHVLHDCSWIQTIKESPLRSYHLHLALHVRHQHSRCALRHAQHTSGQDGRGVFHESQRLGASTNTSSKADDGGGSNSS